MTPVRRKQVEADFFRTLAVELDSHLGNGSEFIFEEGADAAETALKVLLLKREVARLERMAASRCPEVKP